MRQDYNVLKITLIFLLILVFNLFHYVLSAPLTNLHHLIFRLNYLPIVVAAFWYGWRGGVGAALLITLILLPDMFLFHWRVSSDLNSLLEILLYNVVGTVTGMLSSAEMRQRQRYNETAAQLAKAEHLAQLGQMAASLAHEIRNPLQSLQATTSMLNEAKSRAAGLEGDLKPALERSEGTESRRNELASIMREEVERLNALVNDFLQFANPKPPLGVETDLNHLVEKTVEIIQLRLSSSSIPLHLSLMKGLPNCRMDPEQIQQVLLNLLENAIEAVEEEGQIQIVTRYQSDAVFVDVIDSGKGIDPADIPHIFEPFFSRSARGAGLGLSICQKIIEAHQGKIWCRRNDDKGCSFTFSLPMVN